MTIWRIAAPMTVVFRPGSPRPAIVPACVRTRSRYAKAAKLGSAERGKPEHDGNPREHQSNCREHGHLPQTGKGCEREAEVGDDGRHDADRQPRQQRAHQRPRITPVGGPRT